MNPILARRALGGQSGKLGLASAVAVAMASFAPSAALAQDSEGELEEITVTGSRLKANPNLSAATPILSVSGAEGEIRGNVRVEDFVNVLPQVFAGQASEVSNGATGTATLNLRGLGRNRTLVLIDGKRLPYGSSSVSAPNLDIVPMAMVDRVDILTGGASAVYGSDAIGGVANFVLKRNFEGVEVGAQYGTSYNSNSDNFWANVLEAGSQPVPGSNYDGEETLIYAMMGGNMEGGRGNVTLYASYEDRNEILQSDRVFSGCALGQDDGPESFGGFGCVGSANFRLFGGPGGFAFQEEDGTIVPYAGGPSQTFNFGPFNFFQRPSQRYTIYTKGYMDVTDNLEVFADLSYMTNISDAQIAPTASFGIGAYSVNCDNPYISGTPGLDIASDIFGCSATDIANGTIVSGLTASHRNVEGGPRNSKLENNALRLVTGLRGSFGQNDAWGWEAFLQSSETRDQSESTNDFVVANLQQALFAVDDGNGNVVCTDPSGGCVPYNPFQRNGTDTAITPEQIAFLHGRGLVNGETSQFAYGASLQADLGEYGIKIPTADYGVSFLVGVEYRKDTLESRPDEISQVPGGGFTGVGGATLAVAGEIEVNEVFTEFEIPLLNDITAFQELTLRGQYRFSDYEAAGNNTTNNFDANAYGASLAWAPIDSLRIRAQYQRAVRAPNVIELYTGQNTGLPNLSPAGTNSNGVQLFDPCASDAPLFDQATCARSGVTAAQYGTILDVISGQTQSLTGGNPQLDPETADTVTLGFVWTPEFLEGLSVSVDYFNILVEDAISAGIPAQTTLDECHATGNAIFCDLIQRSSVGSLAAGTFGVGFQQTNVNIAELETTGVDLQILYDFDIGNQNFRLDYASTIVDQLDTVPFPGADPIECSGKFGNQCDIVPEYRHRLVGTWVSPWNIDVSATWRMFGGTDNDNEAEELETSFDDVHYLDLTGSWYLLDDSVTIRVSILNALGQDPEIFSGAGPALGNGNTYPTVYDTGTVYTAALKYRF